MSNRIGFAVLLILWSTVAGARHSSGILDPRRATPGIEIELVPSAPDSNADRAKYRLRAKGLPRGITFEIWTKDFGQQFVTVLSGFRLNEVDDPVSTDGEGRSRKLADVVLDPGVIPRGAAWMVALASEDHSLSAFARVIPQPIIGRDGSCEIQMELISLHGNRFIASGKGFAPGEEVDIELHSSGREIQKKAHVSPDGVLPSDVVSHGAISADSNARYQVRARACAPVVDYEWGEAAMARRRAGTPAGQ